MVVAIDQYSATRLVYRWRHGCLHAQLIERLTQAGARIVVFDLIFDKPSDNIAHDEQLVASMEAAGNIVLVERLVHDDSAFYADSLERREHRITQEGPIQLLPAVANAIKAHAPFRCQSPRVNHYWVFKAMPEISLHSDGSNKSLYYRFMMISSDCYAMLARHMRKRCLFEKRQRLISKISFFLCTSY